MTLYLIGLGLGDEKDITVKGLELVKKAEIVYLEHYTSLLAAKIEDLEKFYGRDVRLADRNLVEKEAEQILLAPAKTRAVVLLVVGDPFGATTHQDLLLRAQRAGVAVEIVHNASILNAIGEVGLDLYKYGRTVSLPFWEESFTPETPYDMIKENKTRGLHTLCLLDIKIAEPSKNQMLATTTPLHVAAPTPRFMTIPNGVDILLRIAQRRSDNLITPETMLIGVARLGQPTQKIVAGPARLLREQDLGPPLHCLIIPGSLQFMEEEALSLWTL